MSDAITPAPKRPRKPRGERVAGVAFGQSTRAVVVPAPPVLVDMNLYRQMSDALRLAFERFWEACAGKPVPLGDDGLPTLAYYDSCRRALEIWGIYNVRLDWDPEKRVLKVS